MNKKVGLSVLSVLILSACSIDEPQELLQSETMTLTAKVEGSKANKVVEIGANYTTSLDVAFVRLDQDSLTGIYPLTYHDVNSALSATRDGGVDATGVLFEEPQYYQLACRNGNTRLVGWFPALTPKAGVITFDISDGATDVMLTQELVGNVNKKIGTNENPFLFRHQLCQLIVSVVATSQETVERWGTVASVAVKNLPTSYVVTLPGATKAIGSADIVLNQRGEAKKMSPVQLSTSRFAECGYLLMAPVESKLTLELTGGNGERRVVEAPLSAGQHFYSGYIYHLKLNIDEILTTTMSTIGWAEEVNLDVEF